MSTNKIRLLVFKDGKQEVQEFSAIIGIQIINDRYLLHITETNELNETFWRALPKLLQDTIERGLQERRKSLNYKPNGG